jgi:predicted nucleic acid-binding protein
MPLVLVSDTSVLVDLHRGGILDVALGLPYRFAVPDLLFERELKLWPDLGIAGRIEVLSLDGPAVELASSFRRADSRLSLPDAFALALAKTGGYTLLAGDASLRAMAESEGVACHGVLWVLDELEEHALALTEVLHAALSRLSQHPRCRLPKSEIRRRMDRWTHGST